MSDEDKAPQPKLGSDPLHNTEGFAGRHLLRGLYVFIALIVIVCAHQFLDCGGGQ